MLAGDGGDDTVFGGPRNDHIFGGSDTLRGAEGDDYSFGSGGDATSAWMEAHGYADARGVMDCHRFNNNHPRPGPRARR